MCIVSFLEPFGSDAACVDAARVLRIPGTTKAKTGRIVSIVDGDGHRYSFDSIADALTAPPAARRDRSCESEGPAPP